MDSKKKIPIIVTIFVKIIPDWLTLLVCAIEIRLVIRTV